MLMLNFSQGITPGNEHEVMMAFVQFAGANGFFLGVAKGGALNLFFTLDQARKYSKNVNPVLFAAVEHAREMDFTYLPPFGMQAMTESELKAATTAHDKLFQRNADIIKCCTEIVAWINNHMTPEQVKEMNGDTNLMTIDFRVQGNLFFNYLNRCLDKTVIALDKQIASPVADSQLASIFVLAKEEEINRLDAITGETTTDRQRVSICNTGLARRLESGGSMNASYEIFVDGILKLNRTKMSITLVELKDFIKRWETQHPLVATAASVMGVNAVAIPIPPAPIGGGKSQKALKNAARKARAANAAGAIGGGAPAPAPAPLPPPAAKVCTGCNKAGHLFINCFLNPDNLNSTIAEIRAKK